MNKIFSYCFLLLMFSVSLFLPSYTLEDLLESAETKQTFVSTGEGVIANLIGFNNFNHQIIEDEDNIVIGEVVELDSNKISLQIILDKLGLLVTQKHKLNSCVIICGVSKLLPYKNQNENFNVQIKATDKTIIVASPKFMN